MLFVTNMNDSFAGEGWGCVGFSVVELCRSESGDGNKYFIAQTSVLPALFISLQIFTLPADLVHLRDIVTFGLILYQILSRRIFFLHQSLRLGVSFPFELLDCGYAKFNLWKFLTSTSVVCDIFFQHGQEVNFGQKQCATTMETKWVDKPIS